MANLPSALSDTVTIGGRKVPIVAIGLGVGGLAAVAVLLRRRANPPVAPAAPAATTPGSSFEAASAADVIALQQQLAGITPNLTATFQQAQADQLAQFTGQVSGLQGQFQKQVGDLGSQLTGQLSNVQGDVTNIQNQFNTYKTANDLAVQQLGTATAQRITDAENKAAAAQAQANKASRAARNATLVLARLSEAGAAFSPYVNQQFLAPAQGFITTLDPAQPNTSTYSGV